MASAPRDPYRYFRVEARQLLDALSQGALDLEKESTPAGVSQLLRYAHTLKGAARVVKQPQIAECVHTVEDVLLPFRDSAAAVPGDVISRVLGLLDEVSKFLGELGQPEAAPPKAVLAPAASAAPEAPPPPIVAADNAEMDALLEDVTEAFSKMGELRGGLVGVEKSLRLADLLVERLSGRAKESSAAAQAAGLAQELRDLLGSTERELHSGFDLLDRELRLVRESTERLRLTLVHNLFNVLQRTARDTALELNKKVRFEGRGGKVRLDAAVLAVAQPALVQAVRNALAHGLETAAERQKAGKPETGLITLEVRRQGRQVVFRCRDDGRGIDIHAVRAAAIKKGIDVSALDQESLMQLLLRGGISTAQAATEVAGRGVGLDVVREAALQLQGQVKLESEPGQSTTVELRLPVSLASLEALEVDLGSSRALIPLDAVLETVRTETELFVSTKQGQSFSYRDKVIPVLSLADLLGSRSLEGARSRPSTAKRVTLVILHWGGLEVALSVERLVRIATVVLRPLPELAPADALVAGLALSPQGEAEIIIDPEGVISRLGGYGDPAGEMWATPSTKCILVVDDSPTTRMLEQSILESAGYLVDLAASGEEGLEKVRRTSYDMILVDVEMPGMDGFTFIEHLRREPERSHIPAVLVTSRNAPEDFQRGVDVGSNGYIVKSEFDQQDLLERIRRLTE